MSLRPYLKKWLPEPHRIRNHQHLRHFGSLLHDPNLWHLNRRSSAGGIAIGLFCAFIPLPVHMFVAAAAAILLRRNLPLAVVFTWITNPFTFAPIFFFAYELGNRVLHQPAEQLVFEPSFHWLFEKFTHIWEPLLLGCVILASASALAGYFAVNLVWRLLLFRKRATRKKQRMEDSE
jgi:Uncharacterized protein conserved in bacteria